MSANRPAPTPLRLSYQADEEPLRAERCRYGTRDLPIVQQLRYDPGIDAIRFREPVPFFIILLSNMVLSRCGKQIG